jgi:hypothetical protein
MTKQKSIETLRKKTWKMMSEYVRRRDKGICITCGDKRDWKQQNAGHFIHKKCMDFNFKAINCQCVRCNKYKHGNLVYYAKFLIDRHGPKVLKELIDTSERNKLETVDELLQLQVELKRRIRTCTP